MDTKVTLILILILIFLILILINPACVCVCVCVCVKSTFYSQQPIPQPPSCRLPCSATLCNGNKLTPRLVTKALTPFITEEFRPRTR